MAPPSYSFSRNSLVASFDKMANTGENALLDRPGIRAVAEHLQVMVGFHVEQVEVAQGGLDVGGNIAKVGGKARRTPSDSKTKPTGSAASWGMVKGLMLASPNVIGIRRRKIRWREAR